jgi:tetratricopeptide (TPR) repeat protein
MSSDKKEWQKPERYVPSGPDAPILPPQLSDFNYKDVDSFVKDLKKMPFFMTQLDDDEDAEGNKELEALQAMSYEGDPHEIAENFKTQGNDCYKHKRYTDAVEYYTQAIAVDISSSSDKKIEDIEEREKEAKLLKEIKVACYSNRAACNLELRNYRRCINDCKSALMLDPTHTKSTFRAGKAYLATEHLGEAVQILEYGKTLFPEASDSNKAKPVQLQAIESLLETVLKRQKTLEALEAKRRAAAELKETKSRNLQAALDAHGFSVLMTSNVSRHVDDDDSNDNKLLPSDTKIQLEDPLNPASTLYLPILFLYPLEMQSDIIQQAEADSLLSDHIAQLFESPPPWFEKDFESYSRDYAYKNLLVYAQTRAGGLVKIGKNFSIEKVLSLKTPCIPIIDGVARFYILPKNKAQDWVAGWNKDQAHKQLNGF